MSWILWAVGAGPSGKKQKQKQNKKRYKTVSFCVCSYLIVIAFVNAYWQKKLSGRAWSLIRYESLYFRDRRGALRSGYRNCAETTVLMCEQKTYPVNGFRSGVKAIRYSVNISLHYNCITFGGSLCTTRSTSGISSPLAATSVATKQRTFPSRKLCRVNKIW